MDEIQKICLSFEVNLRHHLRNDQFYILKRSIELENDIHMFILESSFEFKIIIKYNWSELPDDVIIIKKCCY